MYVLSTHSTLVGEKKQLCVTSASHLPRPGVPACQAAALQGVLVGTVLVAPPVWP